MLSRLKSGFFLATLLALIPFRGFAQDLQITIVEQSGTQFFEPTTRQFVIEYEPMQLSVRIRNASDRAARINPGPMFTFELTDAEGRITVMKPRKEASRWSRPIAFALLEPGLSINLSMEFDPAEWENMPSMQPGHTHRYKVRAIYENYDTRKTYSEPYELVIAIRPSRAAQL